MVARSILLMLAVPLLLGAAPRGGASPEAPKAAAADEASPSLDALRKRCYGGRGAKASSFELSEWDRSALRAAARGKHERLAYWTRKALRGHGDERRLLPSFLIASEQSEARLSDEALDACNELFTSLATDEDA